jgi:exonuclease VII large subunit
MIEDIESALTAASADAAKYVPDRLNDVQTRLDDLNTAFSAQDYPAVLARGPAILTEAQGLAGAAAARKAEIMQDLNAQWTSLAAALPEDATALESRIDQLSRKSHGKLAAGIDLSAAKGDLSDATSEWSKAQGAFGNGNMDEAVSTAKDVKSKFEALAGKLNVTLPPSG